MTAKFLSRSRASGASTAPLPPPANPAAADAASPGGQPQAGVDGTKRRQGALFMILLLLAAGWGVYSRVSTFGFIPLDDPGYVYENPALHQGLTFGAIKWAFTTLTRANWHPLTWLSLMVDYHFYGLNAGGYHLTNLLLHEASTILLFLWLWTATGRLWPSGVAALLFCIHPTHVESVAWVTERKDTLSTVFFFLLLIAWTRYGQTGKARYYLAALLALILGLLAKPMLVTVPPLLLLVDAWPLRRWKSLRDFPGLVLEKLPLLLVALASCVITFVAQHSGGATVALDLLPLSWRCSGAVTAYASYLRELVWPINLGVFYPYRATMPGAQTAVLLLGFAAATFGAAWWYRTRPYLLIGWLWFLGTLVPVIGLVQVGSQAMADRYLYLPSVGFFIALCWAGAELWEKFPKWRLPLALASGCALAACAAACYQQTGYWKDGATLFEHTLAVTRPTPHVRGILADSYTLLRKYGAATSILDSLLKENPEDADLITKRGYVELEQGHWEPACRWLGRIARRPDCTDPVLYSNLGLALVHIGRSDEAIAALHRSLQLQPDYANAHCNLGDALAAIWKPAEAAREYEIALALNPTLTRAITQLCWLDSFADTAPTPEHARRALELAGQAMRLLGNGNITALDCLAAAHAANGQWPEAASAAQAALGLMQGSSLVEVPPMHREWLEAYRSGKWPER